MFGMLRRSVRTVNRSAPASMDWSKLDIWQAATDHHRLVTALKPLYPARWISTGASKGGMASVYHRRFYPADVTATIAYVAPRVTPIYPRVGGSLLECSGDPRVIASVLVESQAFFAEGDGGFPVSSREADLGQTADEIEQLR